MGIRRERGGVRERGEGRCGRWGAGRCQKPRGRIPRAEVLFRVRGQGLALYPHPGLGVTPGLTDAGLKQRAHRLLGQVSVTGGEAASAQGCRPWTESGLDPRAPVCGDGFLLPPPNAGARRGLGRCEEARGEGRGRGRTCKRTCADVTGARADGTRKRSLREKPRAQEIATVLHAHMASVCWGTPRAGVLGHSLKKSCFFPKVSSNFD